jgi:hypothetical protein
VSAAAPTPAIRPETSGDETEIARLLTGAFGGTAEDAAGRRLVHAAGFAPFLPPG